MPTSMASRPKPRGRFEIYPVYPTFSDRTGMADTILLGRLGELRNVAAGQDLSRDQRTWSGLAGEFSGISSPPHQRRARNPCGHLAALYPSARERHVCTRPPNNWGANVRLSARALPQTNCPMACMMQTNAWRSPEPTCHILRRPWHACDIVLTCPGLASCCAQKIAAAIVVRSSPSPPSSPLPPPSSPPQLCHSRGYHPAQPRPPPPSTVAPSPPQPTVPLP